MRESLSQLLVFIIINDVHIVEIISVCNKINLFYDIFICETLLNKQFASLFVSIGRLP